MRAFGITTVGALALVLGLNLTGCSSTHPKSARDLALIEASRKGNVKKVQSLIRKGADVNATDKEGWTPYLAASSAGNWDVMRVLQDHHCKTDPGF